MRYVFKLLVLAAFAVGTTLTVGCGDTATTSDTPAVTGNVSQVSFNVEGMK